MAFRPGPVCFIDLGHPLFAAARSVSFRIFQDLRAHAGQTTQKASGEKFAGRGFSQCLHGYSNRQGGLSDGTAERAD